MMWFPAIDDYAIANSASLFLDTKSYMHENISAWTDHPRIIPVPEFPSVCTEGTLIFMAGETNAHRLENDPLLIGSFQDAIKLHSQYGCVVVFQDTPGWEHTPDLPVNPLQCLRSDNPVVSCRKEKARMITSFESTHLPDLKDVHVVDMIDTVCPYYPYCYAYDHTIPVWRDSHHLTAPMVKRIKNIVYDKIEQFPCVKTWKGI